MVHQGQFNTRLLGFGVACWSKTRETLLPRERLITAGRPYPLRQEEPKRRGGYPCLQALSHEAATAPSAGTTTAAAVEKQSSRPLETLQHPNKPQGAAAVEKQSSGPLETLQHPNRPLLTEQPQQLRSPAPGQEVVTVLM